MVPQFMKNPTVAKTPTALFAVQSIQEWEIYICEGTGETWRLPDIVFKNILNFSTVKFMLLCPYIKYL